MRKYSLRSVFLTGALLAIATACAVPDAAAQGKTVFTPSSHNFGDIQEGTKARHVFTFTNEGNRPVAIRNVEVSCGCTTPEFTRTAVAPGETGQVTVVYDSQGRPGPFRRSVRVITDGQPSAAMLYVEGNVRSVSMDRAVAQGNVVFDQDVHRVGTINGNSEFPARVRMQNKGDRPVRITGVTASSPNVSVSYPDRPIFSGETVDLDIVISTKDLKAGSRFDYAVTVDTNDTDQPKKSLRFAGQIAASSASN